MFTFPNIIQCELQQSKGGKTWFFLLSIIYIHHGSHAVNHGFMGTTSWCLISYICGSISESQLGLFLCKEKKILC